MADTHGDLPEVCHSCVTGERHLQPPLRRQLGTEVVGSYSSLERETLEKSFEGSEVALEGGLGKTLFPLRHTTRGVGGIVTESEQALEAGRRRVWAVGQSASVATSGPRPAAQASASHPGTLSYSISQEAAQRGP